MTASSRKLHIYRIDLTVNRNFVTNTTEKK